MRAIKILFLFTVVLFINFCLVKSAALAMTENKAPESAIILWTDGPRLKAVNLTFFPNRSGPIGIISVPVYTCLTSESAGETITIRDYYFRHGREELIAQLESLFESPIGAYITIDQKALNNVSGAIGQISMAGRETTLMDVFEGNYTDGPVNLQVEIRQLADAMMTPDLLLKAPKVIWVFSREMESNITPRHITAFYRVLCYRGSRVLQKKAVPGRDYIIGNRKYRWVEPGTWSQTLKEVTS